MNGTKGIIAASGILGSTGISSGSGGGTPPPSGSVLVVESLAPLGVPAEVGFTTTSSAGQNIGSLQPDLIIEGQPIIILNTFIESGTKFIDSSIAAPATVPHNFTFNGDTYLFNVVDNAYRCQSDDLYDFLQANTGANIQFTAEAIAPSGNLTFGDTSPLTGFTSKGYAGASFPLQVGGLTPDVLLNGIRLDGIFTPENTTPGSNEVALLAQSGQPNDFGDSSKNYNLTFNGDTYLFEFGNQNYSTNSAALKQFIENKAISGDAVVFTAEEVAPDLVVGFSSETGDLRGFNDGTVSSTYISGFEQYGSTTISSMPNGESIGEIGFGRTGLSGRVIISRPNNATFTDVGSLYANFNGESYELTTGFGGNFQGSYLSTQLTSIWTYIGGLSENEGISFSITESPLFSLAI